MPSPLPVGVKGRSRQSQTTGPGIRMSLDIEAFDEVFNEYMKFQKRLPADVINAKLFFIARNCTMLTKAADKGRIESDMRAKADDYDAPLGAIIINSQLGKRGEKGLTGKAMERAVEKLIKRRKAAVNFVRSGWKNAIIILENYMRAKGELRFVRRWQSMAPVNNETMRKQNFQKLGKAQPALIERTGRTYGIIQNDVGGKKEEGSSRLIRIKESGLDKAIRKETASMQLYIQRKLNPIHDNFKQTQNFRSIRTI